MLSGRLTILGLGAAAAGRLLAGCATLDSMAQSGITIPVAGVNVNTASIASSVKAVSKTFEDITPEQEYYIGRTIGAQILNKYRPYSKKAANRYINVMGQTLAQASDRPETFGGYHFLIQDSDEINALAAPGGLIFITRGMLRCCPHEDAVAAVLAHEIGHVQHQHGLQAIKKSRLTDALTTLAVEGTKTFGNEQLASLTTAFEDSITDITSTLINSGYSRAFEQTADVAAISILQRVGYNPNGLVDMLKQMDRQLKPGRLDFAKTHPDPQTRISQITSQIGVYQPVNLIKNRQSRFEAALKGV
ncbi:MAG: peptidase M48 [Desulfobacteraceae bacterium]|nr:MAG: peptidase M48 [Desulfobacteraceae bacterium]